MLKKELTIFSSVAYNPGEYLCKKKKTIKDLTIPITLVARIQIFVSKYFLNEFNWSFL